MHRKFISTFVILLALAACADIPDLTVAPAISGGRSVSPALIPIQPLLDNADLEGLSAQAQANLLSSQVARLRARAAAMRRPVVDRHTRRLMAAALNRHIR